VTDPSAAHAVAPGSPTFELHTLGWRAFQDLCAAVVREVLGQSVQSFADSNDAGRDGAFYGIWHDPPGQGMRDILVGPFVLQCKHTRTPRATLALSKLEDEFGKVRALVDQGLCHSYVLMTNARVSASTEADIQDRLHQAGVQHPLILGYQWLCDTIARNRALRLFVPRVYGLGDLSQILDERAYVQASVLMASARDQMATFVVTAPYRKAAEAVRSHRFVLLLGEPAVGKSVIALMLALAAADNWDCLTVKARTANELVARWNPHEPGQFFWVDDAFGAVRHEEQLTDDWSRSMPHVMAAIGKGARVVLTSRNYIYQDARPLLKEYAYPRLREQQVIVDVEDISLEERRQILYNHIACGDQPARVRRQMKSFLEGAAAVEPFRPEMARRLGLRAFTTGLSVTRSGIDKFMASPRQLLRDVYEQFGVDEQAALTLVYTAINSYLKNPLALDEAQLAIIARVGSTPAGAARALNSLTGSFLRSTDQLSAIPGFAFRSPPVPGDRGDSLPLTGLRPANTGWVFRHPTLFEGFASWLSTQPHLVNLVLAGLTDLSLLTSIDCEAEDADEEHGVLLRIPPALYRDVAERLAAIGRRSPDGPVTVRDAVAGWGDPKAVQRAFLGFLARRSSDAFLRTYLEVDPGLLARLTAFTSFVEVVPQPDALARLLQAHLLSEKIRLQAVDRMAHLAVETPDSGWLHLPAWEVLLTPGERNQLMDAVRTKFVSELDMGEGWCPDERDEDDPVERALLDYKMAFEDAGDTQAASALEEALDLFRELPTRPAEGYAPDKDWGPEQDWDAGDSGYERRHSSLVQPPKPSRSIFDDIDR
jgi:hypothetical protein